MSSFNWLYRRLRLVTPRELLVYRIPQFIKVKIVEKIWVFLGGKPELLFFRKHNNTTSYYCSTLPNLSDLPIFNTTINVLNNSKWRYDLLNDIDSKLNYFGDINKQNISVYGDVKVVSEISRFYQLPFLAINSSFQKVYDQLFQWNEQNPYMMSINWKSGMEVAIRSVNIIYTHKVLASVGKLDEKTNKLIGFYISNNYHYLKGHLSLFSSANNHLIAELVGLIAITCHFETRRFAVERKKWIRLFESEVRKQVLQDGVNMELSSRYHTEVFDYLINAYCFIKLANEELSEDVVQLIARMSEFVSHILGFGFPTEFGDSDNGHLIFPYFEQGYSIYSSLLKTSEILFRKNFHNTPKKIDYRNELIFGNTGNLESTFDKSELLEDKFFKAGGYCFFYDRSEKLKVSLDVGKIGDHLSAAHGHSDILHFTLDIDNQPFIIDTGTYQYHQSDIFWRDYFRSTRAHNTICINDQNQAKINNRMSWTNKPEVRVLATRMERLKSFCEAEHYGYRERYGVVHRRRLEVDRAAKEIRIDDKLIGINSRHVAHVFFHIHPDITISRESEGDLKLISKCGSKEALLKLKALSNIRIIKASNNPPLGWYSPSFNTKVPTNSIVATVTDGESKIVIQY